MMVLKKVILATAILFSLPTFSQVKEGKNMVKLNLSAIVLKGINVQYERKISHRATIALGYGKIPTSSIAFHSIISSFINSPNVKVDDYLLGSSVITPEIRFYYGKGGAFHGFYLSVYGRIGNFNLEGPIHYSASNNADRLALFNGTLKTYTAGIMVGSSFKLSQKLYLDWWILGGGVGAEKGDFNAATKLSDSDRMALQSTLDNLDIPFATVDAQVTKDGATVKTTGNIAGLRGLGINLGFRF